MKIDHRFKAVTLRGEDGSTLTVEYDNRGDPYREGLSVVFDSGDNDRAVRVFLETRDVRELHDALSTALGTAPR